jgi:hypothetical protein
VLCAPYQLRNYAEPKTFSSVKLVEVGFPSSICTVQDHILGTTGDALSPKPTQIKAGLYAYTIMNILVILEASVVFMSVWLQRQGGL